MEVGVAGIGQAQALDQQPTGAQATEATSTHLVGDVVVDVAIGEQAAALLGPLPLAETMLDATLAVAQAFGSSVFRCKQRRPGSPLPTPGYGRWCTAPRPSPGSRPGSAGSTGCPPPSARTTASGSPAPCCSALPRPHSFDRHQSS